jgi:DNA replication protein DnaD
MLMLANHEDKEILLGNKVVTVKAGSFITSEVKLAERWGWSRHKVRDFLDLLKAEKMLDKISDSKKTTIFIDNYAVYQDAQKTSRDSSRTAQGHLKDTNNNDNNANKELSYSFSCMDVGLIVAKGLAKGIYLDHGEVEQMLSEKGKEATLEYFGLE